MKRVSNSFKSMVHRLLTSAAIAAVSLDPVASSAAVTEKYSEGTLVEALDVEALEEWSSSDRVRILRSFAHDPRVPVRVAAAAQLRHLSIPLSHAARSLISELACDESPEVQKSTARSLAILLEGMPGLDRTHLVCKWGGSGRYGLELLVARALEYSVDVHGGNTVIEHLSNHPRPEVREAAARAAWVRRALDPPRYDVVLHRLEADPDPRVAEVAALAEGC